jgi:hypothetical protein
MIGIPVAEPFHCSGVVPSEESVMPVVPHSANES